MINLITQYPLIGLAFIVSILIALTVHEFAHGFVAYLYGDDTAKRMGRLTFNPFAHLDLFGALLFLLIGFGWGKPVPINPNNFKKLKQGEIFSSLAGPFSNLLLAIIFALLFLIFKSVLLPNNLLYIFLLMSFRLNIALMLFNLIPVPPLDGSHLINHLLPSRYFKLKIYLNVYGPQILFLIIIFAILFNINIFWWISAFVDWFGKLFGLPVIF